MEDGNTGTGEGRDIQAQLDQLRAQVDALIKHQAASGATCAENMICDAMRTTRRRADELASHIREQPFRALLIAGAAGFLLGRVLR